MKLLRMIRRWWTCSKPLTLGELCERERAEKAMRATERARKPS